MLRRLEHPEDSLEYKTMILCWKRRKANKTTKGTNEKKPYLLLSRVISNFSFEEQIVLMNISS